MDHARSTRVLVLVLVLDSLPSKLTSLSIKEGRSQVPLMARGLQPAEKRLTLEWPRGEKERRKDVSEKGTSSSLKNDQRSLKQECGAHREEALAWPPQGKGRRKDVSGRNDLKNEQQQQHL